MVSLACLSVPALPLQLALRAEPALREHPVAVVESERAQAPLCWVNAHAWRCGLRPGMRHAAALSLAGDLRARVVPAEAVRAAVAELTGHLRTYSPHVEPSADEPGVFWLSARGLKHLYRHPQRWGEALRRAVEAEGWQAALAVGQGHFTCYALSRAGRGVRVFRDAPAERRAAGQVPLARLGLPPRELAALAQLGLLRLGDLLRLPADGLAERFGPALYRLHRLAAGALGEPLQPQAERLPARDLLFVEPPERDAARLLFRVKGRLPFLLGQLAARQEALHILHLALRLDDRTEQALTVRPARPTREERLILELLRLRLERVRLNAGVTEIALTADTRPREVEQLPLLPLFPQGRRRDLAAANRALAQLRAEYGEGAVLRASLREGHLPEARFAWEPLEHLDWPQPRPATGPTLVRRLLVTPEPLPGWPRDPARWKSNRVPSTDAIATLHGPFPLSGGWWARPQHRDYYLAEGRAGGLRWVYQDRRDGRWFCQGWVE
jgi:protein ImuB